MHAWIFLMALFSLCLRQRGEREKERREVPSKKEKGIAHVSLGAAATGPKERKKKKNKQKTAKLSS